MRYDVDGFTEGSNPGTRGGWTVVTPEGQVIIERIEHAYLTNNEVELKALEAGCLHAAQGDTIVSDSKVCLAWVSRAGRGKTLSARPDLTPIAQSIWKLQHTKRLYLLWKPREVNRAGRYNEYKRI